MQANKVEREQATEHQQRNDHYLVEDDTDYRELFDEGEVTGFMSHKPLPSSSESNLYHSNVSKKLVVSCC